MKNVEVRYFALFREQAGRQSEPVRTKTDNVGNLFAELCARYTLSDSLPNIKVAVNDEIVDMSASFDDGDTILFFPPVSGG